MHVKNGVPFSMQKLKPNGKHSVIAIMDTLHNLHKPVTVSCSYMLEEQVILMLTYPQNVLNLLKCTYDIFMLLVLICLWLPQRHLVNSS